MANKFLLQVMWQSDKMTESGTENNNL